VPKTMIREDQMGKVPSKYQFPLNVLPVWSQVEAEDEEAAAEAKKDETEGNAEEADEDDYDKEEGGVEDDSSSSEVNDTERAESKSGVASSVESADPPPQTVVLPDKIQNQESVTVLPSEAVDHVVPELSEATVINDSANEGEHQEAIEPTKSSTLDQTVPTTTEVVVEPSEIVDLKDPQDVQDNSAQEKPPVSAPIKEDTQQPPALPVEQEVQQPALAEEVTDKPEEPTTTTTETPSQVVIEEEDDDGDYDKEEGGVENDSSSFEVNDTERVDSKSGVASSVESADPPPQTVVLPDKIQNQESVTVLPSEAVDHVVPELSEATVINDSANEGEHQEAIEPTESSTLDQTVPATTEEPPVSAPIKEDTQQPPALQVEQEVQQPALAEEVTDKPEEPTTTTTETPSQVVVEEEDDDDEKDENGVGSEDLSTDDEIADLLGVPRPSEDEEEQANLETNASSSPQEESTPEVTTEIPLSAQEYVHSNNDDLPQADQPPSSTLKIETTPDPVEDHNKADPTSNPKVEAIPTESTPLNPVNVEEPQPQIVDVSCFSLQAVVIFNGLCSCLNN
jgi:hypothetical protein